MNHKVSRYSLMIAAVIAAAISTLGCVVSPDEQQQGITYLHCRAVMSKNTRAEGFSDTYPISQDFALWAFTLPRGKVWKSHADEALPLLNAKRFTGNPVDSVWYCDTNIEWPYTKAMNFIACSPFEAGGSYSPEKGISFNDYDIEKYDYDLMYTDYITDQMKENNVLGVSIPFYHALSKVDVRAKTIVNNVVITVKKITIVGLHYAGTFNSLLTPQWTPTDEVTDIILYDSSTGTQLQPLISNELHGAVKLLLPQTLSAVMVVEYSETVEGAVTQNKSGNISMATDTWLAGKYYTYTLEFTSDGVSFESIKRN